MNIYQRINQARTAFHTLDLKKSGHNTFAGYQYFELADFIVPALKVFGDAGLCGVVSFDGEYARLTITNTEKPDEQISILSPLGSANLKGAHPIQNIGAVQSYQRRYLWMAALEIVEHDVIDASEPVKESKKKAITPNDGAMEVLTRPQKSEVYRISLAIKNAFGEEDDWKAFGEWTGIEDQDIAKGVWSQLDAGMRNSIKSMKEAEANKQPETEQV